ncbi:uncharacterized protein LOC111624643 [Centruroides sculpturatus]|uniref:uncharacterized protein LOC111624643 n=1 Tax=Centruroides sculpturatus TaxID=218467 RepID=UPI000C6D997A|nr:uncharacterized protein LOC111624643 [Centruroides sculpturatus]
MSSNSEDCPVSLKILYPVIACSKLFGYGTKKNMGKFQQKPYKLFEVYSLFIELFLYANIVIIVLNFATGDIICGKWTELFSGNEHFLYPVCLVSIIVHTLQFSFLKRKKYVFPNNQTTYHNEEMTVNLLQFVWYISLKLYFMLQIVLLFFLDFFLYQAMEGSSDIEIVFCYIDIHLLYTYIIGQFYSHFSLFVSTALLLFFRFNIISQQFIEIRYKFQNLGYVIEDIIQKHSELLHDIDCINELYNMTFAIIYCFFLYLISLLIVSALFLNLPSFYVYCLLHLSMVMVIVVTMISFGLSKFSSSIYGDFIEMNRYSSARFILEYKLKMLNFMKRFAKTPIGVSVGGFFYVKKNFPVRILCRFYSILSAFIELGQSNKKATCHSDGFLLSIFNKTE